MHEMRRKERQITDLAEILKVIRECDVCRLGFCENGQVYIVPLNFGYAQTGDKLTFYFHSALSGRKVNLLRQGGQIGFEMDCAHRLVPSDSQACKFTMMYKSVIGVGHPRELSGAERDDAFRTLMAHYCDQDLPFNPEMLERTLLFAVDVDELTCKVHL